MIMKIVVFVVSPTGRVCAMPVCIDIRWPIQRAVNHLLLFFLIGFLSLASAQQVKVIYL